jgi:hypothetical protein
MGVPTSDLLHNVVRANNSDKISIDELRISLHERGFGVLLILFALPVSIPIPYIPGVTTFFAVPLLFLSCQMLLGFEFPWLPKWLAKKSIKRTTLIMIIVKSAPLLKRVEKVLRPRLLFLSQPEGERIIGFFAFCFAISIALPLPFTNFIPALGIVIMSLGLLSRDGITIFCGILLGSAGVAFTVSVLVFGKKLALKIIHSFFP